jgi:CHASE3 domain sensor protein
MSDVRQRIEQLLSDTSAFTAGQTEERHRIRQLIDIRIDQLQRTVGVRNRQQLCAELLRIRQNLEP